jgi:UDP-N-acetylglucosamine acyltransferase
LNGTTIGKDCVIFPGAVLGGDPQDLKYKGENTRLIVEDQVVIREYCTINRGTAASGQTHIKSSALIMAYTHVAHDCIVGHHAVIANGVNLAGHVVIEDYAIIGGMSAIQQFVTVGESAFIGGGTLVRKDVPPFVKAAREPLAFVGVNSIGLRRRGFKEERIRAIKEIYRYLFVRHNNMSIARAEMQSNTVDSTDKQLILDFIDASKQGILKGFIKNRGE